MDTIVLKADRRTIEGKATKKLRQANSLPAVVYGHGVPSRSVTVDAIDFQKAYRTAGSSSLVDLAIDGAAPVKVLIHAVQPHTTKSTPIHIDFYQVRMTEKVQTDIDLNFIGESAAVKEAGGILIRTLDQVKVECLPGDLVPAIDVDLSALKTFTDRIHVKDIVIPTGITILDGGEEVVASVTPPRSEEELASLSEKVEVDVAAVEKVETKKAEEEPVEGEPVKEKDTPVKAKDKE